MTKIAEFALTAATKTVVTLLIHPAAPTIPVALMESALAVRRSAFRANRRQGRHDALTQTALRMSVTPNMEYASTARTVATVLFALPMTNWNATAKEIPATARTAQTTPDIADATSVATTLIPQTYAIGRAAITMPTNVSGIVNAWANVNILCNPAAV